MRLPSCSGSGATASLCCHRIIRARVTLEPKRGVCVGRVTGREEQEPADAVFSCEERTLLVRMTLACACRRSSTALSAVLLLGIEMP